MRSIATTIFLAALIFGAVGCGSKKTATSTSSISTTTDANVLTVSTLPPVYKQPVYCPTNHSTKQYLTWIDIDLDALSRNQDTCGSYTDWFVPNVLDALAAGTTRSVIDKRIDRLVMLANEGKFLSSYESLIFMNGGEAAVRKYIEASIDQK